MDDDVIGAESRVRPSPLLRDAVAAVQSRAVDAAALEAGGVERADVESLAKAGVLSAGLVDGWEPAQVRELHEQLAGASGALWFVVTQHRSPAEAARASSNDTLRDRWAQELVSGEGLGAVSFAHLRRPGRATVTAVPSADGWRIDGRLDWITSWGLADALLLMAETPTGDVVQALIPAEDRAGLAITGHLELAAMQGTSTVGAVLEGLHVRQEEVAAVVPKAEWLLTDSWRTANAPAAVFGLTRVALNALVAAGQRRGWTAVDALAESWVQDFVRIRARAYELIDDVPPADLLDERLALRAQITAMAQDVTSTLVAVQAGRAMLMSSPEQRWAREALFALVQAQTHPSREALIAHYAHR